MSWFNINVNESLNTLKGQISNVSNVVHDVFTEGILEEQATTSADGVINKATSDDEILIGLEEANKKIDELNTQCEAKDIEIIKLRQQVEHLIGETQSTAAVGQKSIIKLRQQVEHLIGGTQSTAAVGQKSIIKLRQQVEHLIGGTQSTAAVGQKSKTDAQGNVQPGLEDSWFWESEKAVSSDSSKENDGTISTALKHPRSASDNSLESNENPRIVDSLRRSLDEKDAEIQKLIDENLHLNEKIKHLHRESIEQDKRLVELDQQHTEALQNLVLIKNELQENVATLKKELEAMRVENIEINGKFQYVTKEHNEMKASADETMQQLNDMNKKYKESNEECDRLKNQVDKLQTQLNAKSMEITELNVILEEKDAHSRDGSDKFELIDLEKGKMTSSMKINRLQTELDEINERLSILKDIKDQYYSNVLKLGSVVTEKNCLEEEVKQLKAENQNLLKDMCIARESVERLEVLQKSLDQINLEKEQNELTFINLQNDNLDLQNELDELRAGKELWENTRTVQDVQIIDLQSKYVKLEQTLQQLNDDYEKIQNEHAQCEERISELQTAHDNLKTQAVDLESNLVEENMKVQKQVIDLQSALNSKNASASAADSITLNELKAIVSESLNYETSSATKSIKMYIDAFLRSVKEKYQHLSDIESNRDNLMKQFETVSTEKATLQHEYRTLKADLHHYEKEVAELMKNNGILLNQLESVKAGKLETILEHNEDSIRLESQLEETNKLNVSLQDDFKNLSHKLDESEEEKYEKIEKTNMLQQQMDQMRIDDSKLEIQKCFEDKFKKQNEKIAELTTEMESLYTEKQSTLEEFEQLQQSDTDTMDKLKQQFNQLEDDHRHLNTLMENEKIKYQTQIEELNQMIGELQQSIATNTDKDNNIQLNEIQKKVDLLTQEKQELINAVQMKHNKNIQYHGKIQELNQMLMTVQQQLAHCKSRTQLTEQLSALHGEMAKSADQITFLKEKSDILTQNLLTEQTNQKILQQEKMQLNEEKHSLTKDLNRLREHLIEMENAHTAEMIELQNMLELTRHEVAAMQEEARKSNTAYTSASIRANQHTETIQAQYAVLQQQKDELSARLSKAEDRESKNKAALINLQCVLEQFQKDKDRDVEAMTNRIRNELNDEIAKRQTLLNDIQTLKSQLDEAKAGLLASARISDQLEIAQVTNATIKEKLRKTQDKLHSMEAKLQETESNQADRVDKSLLKNLLIGYIMAPNNDKQQILKLISSVLDFNQHESDKVGLNKSNSGWLNSFLHGQTSPNANQTGGSYSKDTLAEAFVKFLENESRPRSVENAPSLLTISTPPKKSTGDELNRPTTAVQPIMLPDTMLQTFNTPRNSSSILKDILNDS